MQKNTLILVVLIIAFQFNSFAQETVSRDIVLKAYYNFNRTNYFQTFNYSDNQYLWIQPEIINNTLGEFSIGAIIEKSSNRSHEFELMPLSIQKNSLDEVRNPAEHNEWNVNGEGTTTINSRFRYQYNYIFKKRKCDYYIGLSSMVSYFLQDFNPPTSITFPRSFTQIGLVLGLTPGIEIPINDKLVWSFDVPIGIAGANMRRINNKDPSLKLEERKQTLLNGEFWHQGFQVRIGLGFKL